MCTNDVRAIIDANEQIACGGEQKVILFISATYFHAQIHDGAI